MTVFEYPKQKFEMREALEDVRKNAKLVRGNIWDVGMSFDIETTQINNEEYHHAYMYIWQYAVNDIVIYGRTWRDFTAFYRELVEIFSLGKKIPTKGKSVKLYKALCLIHNLSFEFSFLKKRLPWQIKKTKCGYVPNIFTKDAHNVVTATTYHNLEFRCTLNLTDKSLARLAKDYNLEHQKQTGKLDYTKPRNSKTPLTKEELDYCFYDVIVLTDFFKKYYSPVYLHGKGKIPTTKTSIIRNELRRHFEDLRKKGLADYPKGFPTNEQSYKYLMNWVYRGGYTHANAAYTAYELTEETDPDGIDGYDFKSSYPSRFFDKFPYEFKEIDPKDIFDYIYDIENYAVIFTAKFTGLRSRTTHSLESLHKCIESDKVFVDNGRISATEKNGFIVVALTELDYDNYVKFYRWEKMQILGKVFISKKKPLPSYLIDLDCKYYFQKCTMNALLDPVGYMLVKQNLNSIYGLCVSSIFHEDYVFNGTDFELSEFGVDYEKMREKQILLPQWGVYISAISRHEECDRILSFGSDMIYADTDSCKVRNPLKHKNKVTRYNKNFDKKIMKADLSKLDFDFIGCKDEKDLKEKLLGLGRFVHESHITRFKTLGCKRYIMLESDIDKAGNPIGDAHIVAKCAGMKSERFLDMMKGKSDEEIFDKFDFELELPSNISGKMANCYNSEAHSEFIVDYFGNGETMKEKTSVCLFPIPFRMRGFDDYIAFFRALQEKIKRRI